MLAKDIFAEQSKLESLAKRIMLDIQNIISCKRCILYLITFTPPAEEVSLKFNDFTFIQSSDTSFTYNSNNLLALDCLTQLFSNCGSQPTRGFWNPPRVATMLFAKTLLRS